MNIRKFIGATSRDVLRLVREALGADAVVLSNRTLDDGSVEIVALADSDLATITPAAGELANGLAPKTALTPLTPRTPRAALAGGPTVPAMPAATLNPYASAMPDVFSSVFGASPEVGAERTVIDDSDDDEADTAHDAAPDFGQSRMGMPVSSSEAGSFMQRDSAQPSANAASNSNSTPYAAKARQSAARAAQAAQAAQAAVTPRDVLGAASAAFAQAALPPNAEAGATQRTMAESNPWLIDHARRIANREAGETERNAGMSPADAVARGLGVPVDPAIAAEAEQPDWAREAAQLAARRAAQRLGIDGAADPVPGNKDVAASVSEAIRSRVEQVVNETVMSELASLRGMMEEQFAGLMWGERQRRTPVQGALTKQMFAAGFSAQLVKMMIDRLPAVETEEAGMEWIQSVLEANLPVLDDEEALMERGGVFALMGPTGVGKTTTTAKLAARCVMRFGASRVALLTTDSYRIGGHEQLRIFGRILGVSVHAVRDGADLQLALTELKNKHIVLIDTIGMSQRDRAVADQIAMLGGSGRPVQRLLLLSAISHGDTLNEVVQAYQSDADKTPLAGCILTKLDEATNLGAALDTVLRYKLPVHYVSTGQKVPENLYVATRRFLVRSAFCVPRDNSPFVPHEDDIPALLSALSTRSGSHAPEVHFG